jgi:hypothetical protein
MNGEHKKELNLADQVKAAERDKYLAEAAKAQMESKKIENDINDSHKFFNVKTIWSVILGVGFLGFFITYVVVPAANKDNIETRTAIAISYEANRKQQLKIDSNIDSLNKLLKVSKSLKKQNDGYATKINSQKLTLDTLDNKYKTTVLNTNELKKSAEKYKTQISKFKPIVDSFKNEINTTKLLEHNPYTLDLFLIYHGKSTLIENEPTFTVKVKKNETAVFAPTEIYDAGENFMFYEFTMPELEVLTLSIKSKKYKLIPEKIRYTNDDKMITNLGVVCDSTKCIWKVNLYDK